MVSRGCATRLQGFLSVVRAVQYVAAALWPMARAFRCCVLVFSSRGGGFRCGRVGLVVPWCFFLLGAVFVLRCSSSLAVLGARRRGRLPRSSGAVGVSFLMLGWRLWSCGSLCGCYAAGLSGSFSFCCSPCLGLARPGETSGTYCHCRAWIIRLAYKRQPSQLFMVVSRPMPMIPRAAFGKMHLSTQRAGVKRRGHSEELLSGEIVGARVGSTFSGFWFLSFLFDPLLFRL